MDCSSITLAGITMDCAPSLGGIKRVWLTQYKEGLATLDAEGGKIASFGEATWYEYQFRLEFICDSPSREFGSIA